jgi:hypothetical protein
MTVELICTPTQFIFFLCFKPFSMDKFMLLLAILLVTHCIILKDKPADSYAQPALFEPNNNFRGLIAVRTLSHFTLVHARNEWPSYSFAERPWNGSEN